jgi:hypothetical protein
MALVAVDPEVRGGADGFHGGVGGGSTSSSGPEHGGRNHMPKMSFPRFSGEHPRVWRDQCLDFFRVFNTVPLCGTDTSPTYL